MYASTVSRVLYTNSAQLLRCDKWSWSLWQRLVNVGLYADICAKLALQKQLMGFLRRDTLCTLWLGQHGNAFVASFVLQDSVWFAPSTLLTNKGLPCFDLCRIDFTAVSSLPCFIKSWRLGIFHLPSRKRY